MKNRNSVVVVSSLIILITTGSLAQQAGFPAAQVFDTVGIDQNLNTAVPLDLVFTNESGQEVRLGEYFGKRPVIISLVYYRCPMLCNQVLNGMVETFRTLRFTAGQDFDVVTVSIDPLEPHTLAAEKKAQYVEEYGREGVADGWHWLVGRQESITQLAKAVGFKYVYDEQTGQFAHASGIMVVTPDGILARYLFGIEYGGKDLTFSIMEASKGNIGSPVDKILLLCYTYDPATGKYSLVVTNIIRGGGILTVLLLGGYMVRNFVRDRRRVLASRSIPGGPISLN